MSVDVAMVERAVRGDQAAFSTLLGQHRSSVRQFVRRMLRDDAAAEDVTQDAVLIAHQKLGSLRDPAQFKSWLFTIARNQVLMSQRKRTGEPKAYEPLESLPELGLQAGWGNPLGTDELSRRLERHELLEAALSTLEPEEREVVMLRDVEGLSGDETAAALGLTVAAMKSRLHRARLRLVAAVKRGER